MNKRKRKVVCMKNKYEFNSEDRISQLPDDVLVSILSLFTVKEVVVFSTLSRRWESVCNYFCKSTMNLNFDARHTSHAMYPENPWRVMKDHRRMNFIRWVDSVVEKHEGPKIDQFKVCFDLDSAFKYHIDRWIKLAMEKTVQKLELDFSKFKYYIHSEAAFYTFPSRLLRLENLGFQSLQVLHFKRVEVSEKIFEQFLSNCPLLERLTVCKSPSLYGVRVDGLSLKLKHLEIKKCWYLRSIEVFCAPNLVSLYFDGKDTLLTLRNVPKLVELSMNRFYEAGSFIMFAFDQLLCCLHQLEILNINIGCKKFQIYGNSQINKSQALAIRICSHAVLSFRSSSTTFVHDSVSLPGETCVGAVIEIRDFTLSLDGTGLKEKENVRKERLLFDAGMMSFVNSMCEYGGFDIGFQNFDGLLRTLVNEFTIFAKAPKCCLSSLKVVEILGYSGGYRDVEFVVYVIENAVSLEKLVIDPRIYDIYPSPPFSFCKDIEMDIEMEEKGRAHAMEKLKPKVPKSIEFVCL